VAEGLGEHGADAGEGADLADLGAVEVAVYCEGCGAGGGFGGEEEVFEGGGDAVGGAVDVGRGELGVAADDEAFVAGCAEVVDVDDGEEVFRGVAWEGGAAFGDEVALVVAGGEDAVGVGVELVGQEVEEVGLALGGGVEGHGHVHHSVLADDLVELGFDGHLGGIAADDEVFDETLGATSHCICADFDRVEDVVNFPAVEWGFPCVSPAAWDELVDQGGEHLEEGVLKFSDVVVELDAVWVAFDGEPLGFVAGHLDDVGHVFKGTEDLDSVEFAVSCETENQSKASVQDAELIGKRCQARGENARRVSDGAICLPDDILSSSVTLDDCGLCPLQLDVDLLPAARRQVAGEVDIFGAFLMLALQGFSELDYLWGFKFHVFSVER